jgi:hypothetical protein
MLKWSGIFFMLLAVGFMASVLTYAENVTEFLALPGIRRFFILFAIGAILYLLGWYRSKK